MQSGFLSERSDSVGEDADRGGMSPGETARERPLQRMADRAQGARESRVRRALLDVKAEDGTTLLLAAAAAGLAPLVRALLAAGADATAKNSEEESAMHLAAKWEQREVVLALLEGSDLPVSGSK